MTNPTSQASGVAEPDDAVAVLEELLQNFGQMHTWVTSAAAAAMVQQAIGKLSTAAIAAKPAAPAEAMALMDLIEQYAEARHKCGAPEYNAVSSEARKRVIAALRTPTQAPADWQAKRELMDKLDARDAGTPPVVQPAPETAADQMLGRYAEQADEIKELLDAHAPYTTGNILARVAQLLLVQPAGPAVEVASLDRTITFKGKDYMGTLYDCIERAYQAGMEDAKPHPAVAVPGSLTEALERLVHDVRDLMENSEGVAGLHMNGDLAPWSDLKESGRYSSWLGDALEQADAALATTSTASQPESGVKP